MTVTEVVFCICIGALLLTYVVYPGALGVALMLGRPRPPLLVVSDTRPPVTLLIPVHNAARRIIPKLVNTLQTSYPINKLYIMVGLDGCTDGTHEAVQQFTTHNHFVRILENKGRIGKSALLNCMVEAAETDLLVITDVDALLEPGTLELLVTALADVAVGIASSDLVAVKPNDSSVAKAESLYAGLEQMTKQAEGAWWGVCMGAFGPCYAIRKRAYGRIPTGFIGDDLFITLSALQKDYRSTLVRGATCRLSVAGNALDEFDRKARIAAGSYQNMGYWLPRLFQLPFAASLAFFVHKVLRWLGPLWLLGILVTSFLAALYEQLLGALWPIQLGCMLLAGGVLLQRQGFRYMGPLNRIGHFYAMHIAMAVGFFRYATGRIKPFWEPTARTSISR